MVETEVLKFLELDRAADLLRQGELVAFPTETVYGLGALLSNEAAVKRIFEVKRRPVDNPLIAHVSSLAQIEKIAIDVPPSFYRLAEAFFPGPLTIVLRRGPSVPAIVSAGLETIAVRMPDHPIALGLIEAVGEPIVAPSANLSGKPSGTEVAHVLEDFAGVIRAVVDGGKARYGIESTVISLIDTTPWLLRPGAISKEELEAVLGERVLEATSSDRCAAFSPGMRHKHYAPETPSRLFFDFEAFHSYCRQYSNKKLYCLLSPMEGIPEGASSWFPLDAEGLYAHFRRADQLKVDEILIFCDPTTQTQQGLMNRLVRATHSCAIV